MKYPVSLACLLPVLQFFACKFCTGFAIYIIDNKGDIEDFYDVEDTKIGEGSFGRVCRCTNKSTGAERAVKMLRKVRRKSQLIMFQNELSTLKMLDHPHIVKLYEHFEDWVGSC
eukprot:g3538.t1